MIKIKLEADHFWLAAVHVYNLREYLESRKGDPYASYLMLM